MLTETQPEVPTKQHNQVPGSRTSHSADSLCKSSTMDETATPQRENESEVASREIIGIVGHREYYDPIKGFTTLYKVKSRKQLKHADDDDGHDDDESDLEDEQWLVREEIVGVDDDEGDDAYQHGAMGGEVADGGGPAPALGLSREMQSAMSMSLRLSDEGTSHSSLLHCGSSHSMASHGGSKNSAFDLLRAYEVEKQIPVDETESSFASGDMPAGLDGHSRSSLNPSSFSVEGGDDGVSDEGDRVELILSHRNFGGPGDDEYLVQWVGCSPDDDEWVPRIDLIVHERELVLAFEREQADQGAAYVWVPPTPEVGETSPETKQLNAIRHELATTMLVPIFNNAIQQRARQAFVESQSVAKPEPRNPPSAVDSTSQTAADVEPGGIIGIVGHREYYDPIKGFTTLYKVKSRKQLKSDIDDSEYDEEEGGDEEQWLDREAIVGSDDEGDDDAVYEYGAFGEQGTEGGERAPVLGLTREMQSAMSLSLRFSDEGTSHSSLLHCGSSRSMASNGRPKKAALDMLRAYEVEKQIPVDTESSFGSGGMPAGLDGHSRSSLNPSSFSVEGDDDNVSDEGDRVELIVSHRNTGGFGDDEYLVRWMGCSSDDDEWVPRIDLIVHERDLVLAFESTRPSLAKLHQSTPMKRAMSVMLEGSIPKNRLRAIRLELAARMLVPILEDCTRRRAHLDYIAARQRDIAQFANSTAGEAISVAIARVSRRHVSGPAAIVIQTCMRGYLGRREVKQRFAARTIVCCCRWYLLNMRCDYRRQQVWGMITKVRAHTRSAIFGAQVRSRALRKTDAALRIQCARRTVVARRTLANRKRRVLNAVVLIQRSVRGYTARKAFARRRKRYHGACRLIQCVWRGFVARRQWRHTLRSHRFEALVNDARRLHRAELRVIMRYYPAGKVRETRILQLMNTKPLRRHEIPSLTAARRKSLLDSVRHDFDAKKVMRLMQRKRQYAQYPQRPIEQGAIKGEQASNPWIPTITYVKRNKMFGSITSEYNSRFGSGRVGTVVDVQKRAKDAARSFESLPAVIATLRVPPGSFQAPRKFRQSGPLVPALLPNKAKKNGKSPKRQGHSRHEGHDRSSPRGGRDSSVKASFPVLLY